MDCRESHQFPGFIHIWTSRKIATNTFFDRLPKTKIADLVQLKPQDFYKTSLEAIEDKINEKYANKVIPNIGLCVCVWDITDASEGLIGQYDGYVNINGVDFFLFPTL